MGLCCAYIVASCIDPSGSRADNHLIVMEITKMVIRTMIFLDNFDDNYDDEDDEDAEDEEDDNA